MGLLPASDPVILAGLADGHSALYFLRFAPLQVAEEERRRQITQPPLKRPRRSARRRGAYDGASLRSIERRLPSYPSGHMLKQAARRRAGAP